MSTHLHTLHTRWLSFICFEKIDNDNQGPAISKGALDGTWIVLPSAECSVARKHTNLLVRLCDSAIREHLMTCYFRSNN